MSWNQGEDEASARGNPYPWNTPAHDVWNEGYQAAVSKLAQSLIGNRVRNVLNTGDRRA